MAVPPSFVSQITYFDLDTLSHEEFMQELVLAHALLQRAASRDGDDDELIHFHDMQWWYSVSLTPANSSSTPPNWSTLVEESEYREMLQRVTSYYDPTELTVELTNNPAFTSLESGLSPKSYPTVEHSLENGNTKTIPIYPCFFRLRRTPISSIPSISAAVSSCESSETWSLLEPESTESALLQSSDVDCLSSSPSSSSSRISFDTLPTTHDFHAKTHHENYILPSLPPEPRLSSSPPRPPIYIRIRGASIPLPIRDLSDLTNLARRPVHLFKNKPSPAPSKSPTFLRLYLRRASQIPRRYSDRFDRHTIGLSSSVRGSRSCMYSGQPWDIQTYLDIVGLAEAGAAVEEGVQGARECSFVDIEKSSSAEYVMSTSVLWNGRL